MSDKLTRMRAELDALNAELQGATMRERAEINDTRRLVVRAINREEKRLSDEAAHYEMTGEKPTE
jgi:hypothetical protein